MFDLGFLELMICGVIALLVLGPERLPGAARAAGQWIGRARRISRQFTDELDRQVKVDEIRAQLRREESEVGYEDIQRNVQEALDEAKKYEHLILPEAQPREDDLAPADRARLYPKDPDNSPGDTPDSANSTPRQNRDPS